jgi:hypothetical protein
VEFIVDPVRIGVDGERENGNLRLESFSEGFHEEVGVSCATIRFARTVRS